MRSYSLILLCVLAAGCSTSLCDRASQAGLIAGGGPIGLIISLALTCDSAPAAEPAPVVLQPEQQQHEPPDMGSPADLATVPAPSDMAQHAPDLAQPADLSPVQVSLQTKPQFNWLSSGPLVHAGNGYISSAAFDFAAGKQVFAELGIPLVPLAQSGAKNYALVFSVGLDIAWAPLDMGGACAVKPGYLVVSGTSQFCEAGRIFAVLAVNGTDVYATGTVTTTAGANTVLAMPVGAVIPVQPGDELIVRLEVAGNVTLSNIQTSAIVTERF